MAERSPLGNNSIICVGANHRTAPVEFRERLFIDEGTLGHSLTRLKKLGHVAEVMALSTCNRFELAMICPGSEMSAIAVFGELQKLAGHDFRTDELKDHLYAYTMGDAIRHLFEVAASLDSLVLGETQITGQFKDAFQVAQRAETIGPLLHRLYQDALATAKRVRTQTDIGRHPVSISHAAIDLLKKVTGGLKDRLALVIGAGEMASLAAKVIAQEEPRKLWICNRTTSRADDLARSLKGAEVARLDDLTGLLREVDVVIASTGSPDHLITSAILQEAVQMRKGRPLFMIDISIPRNVDPDCAAIDDVYLFDVDDLQQIVGKNQALRQGAKEASVGIVSEAVVQFESWLSQLTVKPYLAEFRSYVDDLFGRELAKTLNRDIFKELSPNQRQALAALNSAVASKLTADAAAAIKTPPDGWFTDIVAEALGVLFAKRTKETP